MKNNYIGLVITDSIKAYPVDTNDTESIILPISDVYSITSWYSASDASSPTPIISFGIYNYYLDLNYLNKVHLLKTEDELLFYKYYSLQSYQQCRYMTSHLRKIFCQNGWEQSYD